MSTTLAILHVLMPSNDNSLLMTSSTPSSLMTSRSTSSIVASLDPVLVKFWSTFPCPPPWNEGLLFRVNWTCVSQTVGERLRWFLADRCNIQHNGTIPVPEGGGGGGGIPGYGGGGEDMEEGSEVCDMACKILVALFCSLFVVGVLVGGVCLLHRRRSQKRKDPRGAQQQTTGGGDRGRSQYAGIHYASASVINREGERPLPPCPEGPDVTRPLPRQLHSYVYNPRHDNHGPGGPGNLAEPRSFHLQLCPANRRAAYRAMEPHRTGSQDNGDELSHHYDYISDTESIRHRGSSIHDYTYCTCDYSEGGASSVAAECNSSTTTPRQSEGYYSDHDHKQHEISKPYPRYPDRAAGDGGKMAVDVGVNNNNHHNVSPFVGAFREGVLPDSGRGQMHIPIQQNYPPIPIGNKHLPIISATPTDFLVDPSGGHRHFPSHIPVLDHTSVVHDTSQPAFIRDQPHTGLPVHTDYRPEPSQTGFAVGRNEASVPLDRPHAQLQNAGSYEMPVDGIRTDRRQGPLQTMNSYEEPVNTPIAHVNHPPHIPVIPETRTDSAPLTFVNAPQGDWDSSAADSNAVVDPHSLHQYPDSPADQSAQRANALAMHPQYFADYFDANTSSV